GLRIRNCAGHSTGTGRYVNAAVWQVSRLKCGIRRGCSDSLDPTSGCRYRSGPQRLIRCAPSRHRGGSGDVQRWLPLVNGKVLQTVCAGNEPSVGLAGEPQQHALVEWYHVEFGLEFPVALDDENQHVEVGPYM